LHHSRQWNLLFREEPRIAGAPWSAFFLPLHQSGWHLEKPDQNVQHSCRHITDCRSNAAYGRFGLCLGAVPPIRPLKHFDKFSHNGNEISWATIGNASTAEGMFWEAFNAIGVLHAPAIISIFDDGYGISVPNQFQMVKENIGSILQGFQRDPCPAGVRRFDDISPYPAGCICETTTNLPNS